MKWKDAILLEIKLDGIRSSDLAPGGRKEEGMRLHCIFGHEYHQIVVTSKTKFENGKESWRWVNYCIVCTKCGDLVELPPIREEMKEVQP